MWYTLGVFLSAMPQKIFRRLLSIFIFPALVFFLNYFLYKTTTIYETQWWADVVMHFLGGWSIAYGAFLAVAWAEEKQYLTIKRWLARCLIVVMLVLSTAVFWEFYEFILDHFWQTLNQPSVADTMMDFFMGLLGGILGCFIATLTKIVPLAPKPVARKNKSNRR